jgi:hypothetical protein
MVAALPALLPEDGVTHARLDWASSPCDSRWSLRMAAGKLLADPRLAEGSYGRSYAVEIRRLAGGGA